MTRDDLIREYTNRRGTWAAFAAVYGLILGALLLSAIAIT